MVKGSAAEGRDEPEHETMISPNESMAYVPEVLSAQAVYPQTMVIGTTPETTRALRAEALRMYGGFEWDGSDLVLSAGQPDEGTAWRIRLQRAR